MFEDYRHIINDLRHFVLFPKRYRQAPADCPPRCYPKEDPEGYRAWADYWRQVRIARYGMEHRVKESDYHWYVVTFKDGRKELAYLKYRTLFYKYADSKGAVCRGVLFTRPLRAVWVAHVKDISLAF